MKRKTTLYLDEGIVRELKKMTVERKSKSITALINQALKIYIKDETKKPKFNYVFKAKNSIPKSVFGDGLEYQKKIRAEWE